MSLVNCVLNDGLVNAMPNMQQTVLQFINVVHTRLIESLLDDAPYYSDFSFHREIRSSISAACSLL